MYVSIFRCTELYSKLSMSAHCKMHNQNSNSSTLAFESMFLCSTMCVCVCLCLFFASQFLNHHFMILTKLRDLFSSVQISRSVVSDSLRPHESQHDRPPCPSPTPRVHSDSRPSSQWCHPAISSSVLPFPSCPHSLPASGSFPMSQLFACVG